MGVLQNVSPWMGDAIVWIPWSVTYRVGDVYYVRGNTKQANAEYTRTSQHIYHFTLRTFRGVSCVALLQIV